MAIQVSIVKHTELKFGIKTSFSNLVYGSRKCFIKMFPPSLLHAHVYVYF